MKTTELFNFRFVDREKEKIIIKKFFSEHTGNTLWLRGGSGLGKTTFFNYVLEQQSTYSLCYINIELDSNSIKIISDLVIELQKLSETSFLAQTKKNYKKFYNTVYKNTQSITEELFPQISNVVSIIMDLGYTAVTWDEQHKNTIDLIVDYITNIIKEKNICICVDNFSRCDLKTAEVFYYIFKSFSTEEKFRSCIVTTSEDLQDNLGDSIYKNLPYKELAINAFDKYIYFCEILKPIFDLHDFQAEDLEYIYNKCNGSPQKLSKIISKLLEKNAIDFEKRTKAKIDKDILFSILQSESIRFKESDFKAVQKWIIFSYLCQEKEVKIEHLESLALYISRRFRLFQTFQEDTFQEEILKLIDNKILKYNQNNTITYWHDSDYRDLIDIFYTSPYKGMFSQYSYEFFKNSAEFPKKNELICKHAQEAKIPGWIPMNFCYGKKLSKKGLIYEAQKIFGRLQDSFFQLHPMQKLYIGLNSYETGNYELAIQQLSMISNDMLKYNSLKYYCYFYLGKSYYNAGNIQKAIKMLEDALSVVAVDCEKYVQTLNVLHMYYFEISDKANKSRSIFEYIWKNYKAKFPEIWANTIRGCHNFLSKHEALDNLKEAEKILSSELEKAFVKNTIGFVQVKCNDIDLAQQYFQEAYDAIRNIKIHESSYAANNLALCYMLKNNFQKAKEILVEALLWNRTEYANLVIQNNLMMCSLYLEEKIEAEDYYEYLKNYIEKPSQDPILNRKIHLNLAIASQMLNKPIAQKMYIEKAKEFVKNTSSEWRYYCLIGECEQHSELRPSSICDNITAFDPWFLIYAHD